MKQGWVEKKLGQILQIERGGSPRPIKKYLTDDPDGLNWIKIGDATASTKYIYHTKQKITKDGLHKTRLVKEGDFILSNSMSFGKPYIMKTTGCIHDGWLVLKEKDGFKLNQDFLYHLLCSPYLFKQFDGLAAGSTVRNLNIALVSSVTVRVPPLEEQKQIVAKLDQCFEAIDKARANAVKNLENAKELFQSKLNDIFSQKGEGWVEKKLGDVCSLIKRGIPPKYIETGGIQVVNQKCIRNHKVNLTLARRHNIVLKSVSQEKLIQIGDVLVNSTGVGTLGRVAQVRDSIISDTTVDTHVTIVRPIPDLFFIDFFGYVLIKIEDEITKSGEGASGQTELARTKLQNNFIVSYPTSLEEQKQIVKILDSLKKQTQSLESKYQQELNSLEELKKSILQKAFEGEL